MLRAGIIGASDAGRAHARALSSLGGSVRVVGVHDINESLAMRTAGELHAETFGDLDELLSAVDLVVVASSTDVHAEHALRAAAAGVDVLVERPVVARAQDVVRLHGAMAKASRRPIVQAGHVALFDPQLRTLLRALAPHEPAVIELRHETPRVSGGPSVEDLLHDAATILHSLTRSGPANVHAATRRHRHGGGLEHVTAMVTCDNGTIATVHVGHLTAAPVQRITVWADAAELLSDSHAGVVTVTPRHQRAGSVAMSAAPTLVLHADGEDAHVAQARAFIAAVAARSVPTVPLAAALPAIELVEQVLRRAEMGERLGSHGPRRAA